MAAVTIQKIPELTGEKGRAFIAAAEQPKDLSLTEQQIQMFRAMAGTSRPDQERQKTHK